MLPAQRAPVQPVAAEDTIVMCVHNAERPECFASTAIPAARVARAKMALGSCSLCEKRCHADRLNRAAVPCGLGSETYCFRRYVSFGDAAEFVPTLRLYLGGCNFRCRFCNVAPQCFSPHRGTLVVPAELARDCEAALSSGVRSISLLGGEPTLHVHSILEVAAAARRPLPIILNTNGYFSPEVPALLAGVIDTYLVDFKFGNDACAEDLAGVDSYMAVLTRNLVHLASCEQLRVRHLLMPGHLECCFLPIVSWLEQHLPDVRVDLMTGYVPGWRAVRDPSLGRLVGLGDVQRAVSVLKAGNLNWRAPGHDQG